MIRNLPPQIPLHLRVSANCGRWQRKRGNADTDIKLHLIRSIQSFWSIRLLEERKNSLLVLLTLLSNTGSVYGVFFKSAIDTAVVLSFVQYDLKQLWKLILLKLWSLLCFSFHYPSFFLLFCNHIIVKNHTTSSCAQAGIHLDIIRITIKVKHKVMRYTTCIIEQSNNIHCYNHVSVNQPVLSFNVRVFRKQDRASYGRFTVIH